MRGSIHVLFALFLSAVVVVAHAAPRDRKIVDGFHPAVSPDGTRLAFARETRGNVDLWVAAIDGSGERRLTTDDAVDRSPCWSPDGLEIAFASRRSGSGDIYVVPADGSAPPRRLTAGDGPEDDPDWAPDGGLIAFGLLQDGSSMIGFVTPEGGEITLLDPHPRAWESDPAFSPDGRWIAIVTDVNEDYDISILPLDAEEWDSGKAESRVVALAPANDLSPTWHPTRSVIVHTTEVESEGISMGGGAEGYGGSATPPGTTVTVVALMSASLHKRSGTVTSARFHADDPTWTPDGLSVVYTRMGDTDARGGSSEGPQVWIRTDVYREKKKDKKKKK